MLPGAERVLLFVYGTLRRSEAGHGLLRGATFLEEVRTVPGYSLVDLGNYPGLLDQGERSIEGELYELSPACLTDLDEYEGCPVLFERGRVLLEDGREAIAYLAGSVFAQDRPRVDLARWPRRAGD